MKKIKKLSLPTICILIVAIAFVTIVPIICKDYNMMVVNLALIYSISTFGLSVLQGMGGQLSFAAVSFMGMGAYMIGNLCTGRWGFWMNTGVALAITLLAVMIIAYLIGMVILRLKNTYFTFATIGLVQVTFVFYMNYKPLFGGPDGISGISTLNIFGFQPASYKQWFFLLVCFVLIVALVVERIRRSRLGRSLASIRDNDTAALTLGVDVYKTKVIAFAIAGTLSALSGALYAMHSHYVSADMFTFERATSYIIMAMLGGVNNTFGIILGSLLVTMLPEWLRSIQGYLQLCYGIGIILLMVFMPDGLAGLFKKLLNDFARKRNKKRSGCDPEKIRQEAK